jgi:hypothetical protein
MNLRCPYLKAQVELTEERETHIREKHPELLPQYRDEVHREPMIFCDKSLNVIPHRRIFRKRPAQPFQLCGSGGNRGIIIH